MEEEEEGHGTRRFYGREGRRKKKQKLPETEKFQFRSFEALQLSLPSSCRADGALLQTKKR